MCVLCGVWGGYGCGMFVIWCVYCVRWVCGVDMVCVSCGVFVMCGVWCLWSVVFVVCGGYVVCVIWCVFVLCVVCVVWCGVCSV